MIERHEQILEILKESGKASVKELSEKLYVCEMTIRRDLRKLAEEKRVKRYNGGAMLYKKDMDFPFVDRKNLYSKEKMQLAKKAAEYIEDASTVFIDSSSTCAYLIPNLTSKKDIKIVTNSLTAAVLALEYNIPCVIAGGDCNNKDMCTVGSFATEMLEKINVDIALLSSNAISCDGLITDSNAEQTAVRRIVVKNAKRAIFIFTENKYNKKEMYTVCKSDDVFKVILE